MGGCGAGSSCGPSSNAVATFRASTAAHGSLTGTEWAASATDDKRPLSACETVQASAGASAGAGSDGGGATSRSGADAVAVATPSATPQPSAAAAAAGGG